MKILKHFFPFLEFFDKKPKRFFNILKISINTTLSIWFYFIAIMIIFPSLGSANYAKVGHIVLYSNQPLSQDGIKILKNINLELKKNRLYDKNVVIYDKEIQSYTLYKVINPFDIFTYPSYAFDFANRAIFHKIDFKNNTIKRYKNDKHIAPAQGVILHEAIHALQYNRYGFFKMRFTVPTWVIEGYAEYSAMKYMKRDTIDNLKKILSKEEKSLNGREKYILWAFMVKYAIENLKINVDDLHLKNIKYQDILKDMRDFYKL